MQVKIADVKIAAKIEKLIWKENKISSANYNTRLATEDGVFG